MAGRIYASMPGLEQEAAAINAAVDAKIPEIDACIRAINAYCGDSSLSGAAYDSSKTLFGVVHVTMLSEMKTQVTLLKEANNQMLSNAASVAPLLGEADSAELEREIAELEQDRDYYWQRYYEAIDEEKTLAVFGIASNSMSSWFAMMAGLMDEAIRQKQNVLEQLYALNSIGGEEYASLLETIGALEKLRNELGDPLGGKYGIPTRGNFDIPDHVIIELADLIKKQIVDQSGKVNRNYLSELMKRDPEYVTQVHYAAMSMAMNSLQLLGNESAVEDFLECCYPRTGKELTVSIADMYYTGYELTPVAMGFIGYYTVETQLALANTGLDLATGDMDNAEVQRINEMVAKSCMLRALLDSGRVFVCEEESDGSLPVKINLTQCDAIRSGKSAELSVNENLTDIMRIMNTTDARPYDYLLTMQGVELNQVSKAIHDPQSQYIQAFVGQMINGRSHMAGNANSVLMQSALRQLRPDSNMFSLMGGIALDTAATGVGFIPVVGDAVETVVSVADYANSVAGRVSEYMESAQKASMVDQTLRMNAEFNIARNVGLQISTNYYSDGTACVAHSNFPLENEEKFRETMGTPDSEGKTPMDYIGLDTNYIEPYIKLLKTNAYIRSDDFLNNCGSYFPNYSGGNG